MAGFETFQQGAEKHKESPITLFGSMKPEWRKDFPDAVLKNVYDPEKNYNVLTGEHHRAEAEQAAMAALNAALILDKTKSLISLFEVGIFSLYNLAAEQATIIGLEKRGNESEKDLPERAIRARALMRVYQDILRAVIADKSRFVQTDDLLVFYDTVVRVGDAVVSGKKFPALTAEEIARMRSFLLTGENGGQLRREIVISGTRPKYTEQGDPAEGDWKKSAMTRFDTDNVTYIDPANPAMREKLGMRKVEDVDALWKGTPAEVEMAARDEVGEKMQSAVILICIPRGLNKDGEPAGTGALAEVGHQLALARILGQKVVFYMEEPEPYPFEGKAGSAPKTFLDAYKGSKEPQAAWEEMWKENMQLRHSVRAHLTSFRKHFPTAAGEILFEASSADEAATVAEEVFLGLPA